MRISIKTVEHPTEADRKAILLPLIAFNESLAGPEGYAPVAVLIRDADNGTTVGGLWGRIVNNWLFIELLFVPEPLRRSGLGTRIMRAAETWAAERQCVGVWLDTYSFQAPSFYAKLGYNIFGRLPDFPRGHERIFLRKLLGPASAENSN